MISFFNYHSFLFLFIYLFFFVFVLRRAKHFNGESKVSLSFHKFRARPVCSSSISDSDSSSDSDYSIENHEWDVFEKSKKDRSGITIGKQGFAKKGNIITTKHDPNVCGRRNTCRVMDFNISIGKCCCFITIKIILIYF